MIVYNDKRAGITYYAYYLATKDTADAVLGYDDWLAVNGAELSIRYTGTYGHLVFTFKNPEDEVAFVLKYGTGI